MSTDGDDLDEFGLGGEERVEGMATGLADQPHVRTRAEKEKLFADGIGRINLPAVTRQRKQPLPPGPWDNEPDESNWHATTGFRCRVARNNLGALCGYVEVPKGHPWHGIPLRSLDSVRVHGGVTLSIDSDAGRGWTAGKWVVGFDCAHSGDLIPSHTFAVPGAVYRDMNYVKDECEKLAQQAFAEGPP